MRVRVRVHKCGDDMLQHVQYMFEHTCTLVFYNTTSTHTIATNQIQANMQAFKFCYKKTISNITVHSASIHVAYAYVYMHMHMYMHTYM